MDEITVITGHENISNILSDNKNVTNNFNHLLETHHD